MTTCAELLTPEAGQELDCRDSKVPLDHRGGFRRIVNEEDCLWCSSSQETLREQ